MDQRVSKEVRETRNTAGIEVAGFVSKNFRPGEDVCRILENRLLGNALWHIINIEVVSDPFLMKERIQSVSRFVRRSPSQKEFTSTQ